MYNKEQALEAWKLFVSTGTLVEGTVRPEIAESWKRCRASGLDPWSSDFDAPNTQLLDEKRSKFAHSLQSTEPVMKSLMALLNCNVSLMDGENFVFELMSPISLYPRTFGTFMREERVGTGNATIVMRAKRPVRVDGYEHYRTIAQQYSSVSVPFLDDRGKYYGALNLNSPFSPLPECALPLCVKATELAAKLHAAREHRGQLLSSPLYLQPLLLLYGDPVVIVDREGCILAANGAMLEYCPDWEEYPYETQSLDAYLGKGPKVHDILKSPEQLEESLTVAFQKPHSRTSKGLKLVRHRLVEITGASPFYLLAFKKEHESEEAESPRAAKKSHVTSGAKRTPVDYIGETPAWKKIDTIVDKVAGTNANVLLLGETGAGKEVVARALHRRSGRKGEFVAVNCGAIPRDLLATELFGYVPGAFTGAREDGAAGKFEFANEGTLFLDEIGEMPLDMQVSLLRVLQERSVIRLGSNQPIDLDVRVIAASNQNIQELIRAKHFRSDLYYRLSLIEISLPPLRARVDDVPLLVEYFNKELSAEMNLTYSPFSQETIDAFKRYSWPGNVRELRNVVERVLIMCDGGGKVGLDDLPIYIGHAVSNDEMGFMGQSPSL